MASIHKQVLIDNASVQVFAEGGGRSRVVWIADLLPHDLAGFVGGMMEQGCAAMKRTLEDSCAAAGTVQSDCGPHASRAR